MSTATLGLALLSGVLSTLSPCVLPLIPIVLGSAASEHRFAPAALAAGLALSFTAIGLFVATVGFAIGLDADVFRYASAIMLVVLGCVLAVPKLQEQFAVVASPIGNWADSRFGGFSQSGISGQFGVGLLLGAVWSPCVGPTLGAAAVLASKGQQLGEVALTMALFGVGAAIPMLVLGSLSRAAMLRLRNRALEAGGTLRMGLGTLLVIIGFAILTGIDKRIETGLLAISPDWLTRLTTSF